MGLFDKVTDALGSSDSSEEEEQEAVGGMFDAPEGFYQDRVDLEKRSGIIHKHYDVTEEQALIITRTLKEWMEDEEGGTIDSIRNDLEGKLEISDELLHTIVWTEHASINTLRRVNGYLEDEDPDDVYKIQASIDDRTHPVTREAVKEIEQRGGAVPMRELASILLEKAEQYEDEGGTPERMEHWVPHERFRFSITRHIEV